MFYPVNIFEFDFHPCKIGPINAGPTNAGPYYRHPPKLTRIRAGGITADKVYDITSVHVDAFFI